MYFTRIMTTNWRASCAILSSLGIYFFAIMLDLIWNISLAIQAFTHSNYYTFNYNK
jgi:hypothetical protein